MSDKLYSGQIENYQAIMQVLARVLQELRSGSIWRARADDGSMWLFTRRREGGSLGAVTTSPCMFDPVRSCTRTLFLHGQPTKRVSPSCYPQVRCCTDGLFALRLVFFIGSNLFLFGYQSDKWTRYIYIKKTNVF